jgi:hypothetical protein
MNSFYVEAQKMSIYCLEIKVSICVTKTLITLQWTEAMAPQVGESHVILNKKNEILLVNKNSLLSNTYSVLQKSKFLYDFG